MEDLLDVVQLGQDCRQLMQFWTEFGHGPDSLEKRKRTVRKYANELFTDMLTEESRRINEKKSEIATLITNVTSLSTQLEDTVAIPSGRNLLETEGLLLKKKGELEGRKKEKMKDWEEAKAVERVLCKELGEEGVEEVEARIPTRDELSTLLAKITSLKTERSTRSEKLAVLADSTATLLSALEKPPENSPVLLTKQYVTQAELRDKELREQWSELEDKWKVMLREVEELLGFLEEDKIDFGLVRPSGLEGLTDTLANLNQKKRTQIPLIINRTRSTITLLSTQCFLTTPLPSPEPATELTLNTHIALLHEVQAYSEKNKTTIDLIRKRSDLFTKFKECELRAEDPSRLNNRGGQLLKEEKERKTLKKKMERMEKEVDREFCVWGVPVGEWLKQEEEEWAKEKEEGKRRKKEETDQHNATQRKRPGTPLMGQSGKKTRPITPRKVLDPAVTYSEFQNHNIFQSTMNKGGKSPKKAQLFTTPKKHMNENF